MSDFTPDDLETKGYFLPEDGQFRLKKLREYVGFLSRLSQPRKADEDQGSMPEIRADEVAICLELLAEQVELVLDDISWPAQRYEEMAPGIDAEPEAAEEIPEEIPDRAGGPCLFGVTLEQIDALNRLIAVISAHGDVVAASDDTGLADHTLPVVGDTIVADAAALRGIIDRVERQRIEPGRSPQAGVDEARAAYRTGRGHWPADGESHAWRPMTRRRKWLRCQAQARWVPSRSFDCHVAG